MTQAALDFTATPQTIVGRLAEYFRERPNVWIDGRELATVGGAYAWRSRVSDLRRAPFSMTIENQERRVEINAAKTITISEYRYVPRGARE